MSREEIAAHAAREDWFRRAFDEEYLDIYLHRDLAEAARAVRLLTRALELRPQMALLDLCCGPGRHLHFFGRCVERAVGIDLSPALLRRAAQHWRADEGDPEAETHCPAGRPPSRRRALLARADMSRLPLADAAFDRVVNLFTSFGYFERESANDAVLAEIARVLRPDGLLAIDHINREAMLAGLVPRGERRLPDGRRLTEHREWDAIARRVNKKVELEGGGRPSRHWHESVRVYEPAELEDKLRTAGLEPVSRLGDYEGAPWHADSPRLLIIARRQIG